MSNVIEYKGYHTKVQYDAEDEILYGKIEGINDLVNFEADKAEDVEKEFHAAVDDYLDFCESVGKEPDKEYKGSFNVRVSPELHKSAVLLASKEDITLNKIVEIALKKYIEVEELQKNYTRSYNESFWDSMMNSQNYYGKTSGKMNFIDFKKKSTRWEK